MIPSTKFFFVALALFLSNTAALPIETQVGDVVMAKPADTVISHGSPIVPADSDYNKAHPHVVLGPPVQGVVPLAQASHSNHEGFKPFMEVHPVNNVQLGPGRITAPETVLSKPYGALKNKNVGAANVALIKDGMDQVTAHGQAAVAHHIAADQHAKAHDANIDAGVAHAAHAANRLIDPALANAHHQASQDHLKAVQGHDTQVKAHTNIALQHEHSAKNPVPGQAHAADNARTSTTGAQHSDDRAQFSGAHAVAAKAHLDAAATHDHAVAGHGQLAPMAHMAGNIPAAQFHHQQAVEHAKSATAHREQALQHSLPGAVPPPHPAASIQHAKNSQARAAQAVAQLQGHH